eukprot:450300_1
MQELTQKGGQQETTTLIQKKEQNKTTRLRIYFIGIFLLGVCLGALLTNIDRMIDASSSSMNTQQQTEYRSYNGACNNLEMPLEGARGNIFRRNKEGAEYYIDQHGVYQTPIFEPRPNPRVISNLIAAADEETGGDGSLNGLGINLMEVFFGQFINHDLQNTNIEHASDINITNLMNSPLRPIQNLSVDDPLYEASSARNGIPQLRAFNSSGTILNHQFEATNNSTGWLDLSTVYGSNQDVAYRLRLFEDGKLLTSDYTVEVIWSNNPFNVYSQNITITNYPPPKSETLLRIDDMLLTETVYGEIIPASLLPQDEIFTFL